MLYLAEAARAFSVVEQLVPRASRTMASRNLAAALRALRSTSVPPPPRKTGDRAASPRAEACDTFIPEPVRDIDKDASAAMPRSSARQSDSAQEPTKREHGSSISIDKRRDGSLPQGLPDARRERDVHPGDQPARLDRD